MTILDIRPGTKVQLRLSSEVAKGENDPNFHVTEYETTVYDILDMHHAELNVPTSGGRIIALPVKVRYNVCFIDGGNLYNAEGVLEDRYKRENFILCRLRFDNPQVKKFQRREFFRLDVNIPIIYSSVEDEIAENMNTMEEIKEALNTPGPGMRVRGLGTILDISGGGIRFSSKTDLSKNKYYLFQFEIKNGEEKKTIEIIGELIRSNFVYDLNNYSNSIRFVYKDTKKQEEIIKYIFDEERRIRQRLQGL